MKMCWLCVEGKCGYAGYCLFQNKDKVCTAKQKNLEEFHRGHACRPINGEIYILTKKEWQELFDKIYDACTGFEELQKYLSDLHNWKVIRPIFDSRIKEVT